MPDRIPPGMYDLPRSAEHPDPMARSHGHDLVPGRVLVGWVSCTCPGSGRERRHLTWECLDCHEMIYDGYHVPADGSAVSYADGLTYLSLPCDGPEGPSAATTRPGPSLAFPEPVSLPHQRAASDAPRRQPT